MDDDDDNEFSWGDSAGGLVFSGVFVSRVGDM